jgi:large subunit ribosomal protein L3
MSGMLGKKIGMTRIFDKNGDMIPVTVIQAGPCVVTQLKTVDTDGYEAVQLGYGTKKEKNTKKAFHGHLKNAGVASQRVLKEFPPFSDREVKLGEVITVDIFKVGEEVKLSGTSKGKGFTGVVKRYGFAGGPVTHGQSDRLRAPGSLGQSSYPSRVFKGIKMAGRKGNKRATVSGLRVVKIDSEKDLLFIKGAVPGARNNYVEIYRVNN